MENDAAQLIQQRLAELPAEVRTAIQSADLGPALRAIGQKHQLHFDQIGELEDEATLAMLGFTPLEKLDERLTEVLRLPPAAGEALAKEVSDTIFGPIRNSMRAFADSRTRVAPPTETQAPAITSVMPAGPMKPPVSPEIHKADVVLSQKTVSVPASTPTPTLATPATPQPVTYKADPYHEPI